MNNSNLKKCNLTDLHVLRDLAIKTYDETFSESNSEALLQKYFEESLNIEKLSEQLQEPNSEFYFIYSAVDYEQTMPAGFLKLNINNEQTDLMDPDALEVEKIYLLNAFKAQGLGKEMITFAVERTIQQDKKYIWLGVWENNFPALAFYKKMGFEQFSSHDFDMGGDIQTDLLLKKVIPIPLSM